jgi:hypothetical protein
MLLRTTIDNETIKNNNNEGLHLKTLLFSYIYIYIGFKFYKILFNYHLRENLISHLCL